MADEAQTIRSINWRDVFPFTNLFKAFPVAVHPSKLVLALTALLLIYAGGRALDGLWLDEPLVHLGEGPGTIDGRSGATLDFPTDADRVAAEKGKPRGIFITFFDYEIQQVNTIAAAVLSGNLIGGDVAAISNFVVTGPAWLLVFHPLYFFLFVVWFLIIWSIFGGAISRIAAVHVARDEKISVRHAVRFSGNKLLSFVFAP